MKSLILMFLFVFSPAIQVSFAKNCSLCQQDQPVGKNLPGQKFLCETCRKKAAQYSGEECCVCLEELEKNIRLLPCLHSVHDQCQPSGADCPVCRRPVQKFLSGLSRSQIMQAAVSWSVPSYFKMSVSDFYLNKYGVMKNGKVNEKLMQNDLSREVKDVLSGISQQRYERIARGEKSLSPKEKLAALSAREVFVMVDRSWSMGSSALHLGTGSVSEMSRWDAAKNMAKGFFSVVRALDPEDFQFGMMLWSSERGKTLNTVFENCNREEDIDLLFRFNPPAGGTPLAGALAALYNRSLKDLLNRDEPFTVIILTDGMPEKPYSVKNFFKNLVSGHRLNSPERQSLASFAFVNVGQDAGAGHFIKDLQENQKSLTGTKSDLITSFEDEFVLGLGSSRFRSAVGPFAVLWKATFAADS